VTPVTTALAGGDTALSTTALVIVGVGSVGFVPLVVALLDGGIDVPTIPIVEQLVVAVVVPMLVAVACSSARNLIVGNTVEKSVLVNPVIKSRRHGDPTRYRGNVGRRGGHTAASNGAPYRVVGHSAPRHLALSTPRTERARSPSGRHRSTRQGRSVPADEPRPRRDPS
jgi:hypothetical protein